MGLRTIRTGSCAEPGRGAGRRRPPSVDPMDGEGWDVRATVRGDRDAPCDVHRRGRRGTGRRDGADYLALCTDREQSPNTLRARAFDLKAWLVFLRLVDVDLLAASPEHVDQFAGWL